MFYFRTTVAAALVWMVEPVKLDLLAKDFDANVLTVHLQIITARKKVSIYKSGDIIATKTRLGLSGSL